MMKVYVCLFAVVATTLALPHGDHGDHGSHGEHYTDKYDSINVDEILANDRLFDPYMLCMLDLGRCTTEAKELKSHTKEALETNCDKCTDIQKEQTKKVIRHLINNKPDEWDKLKQKYDPEGKYSKKYERELKTVKA